MKRFLVGTPEQEWPNAKPHACHGTLRYGWRHEDFGGYLPDGSFVRAILTLQGWMVIE